jgi:GNAT superfamily N-acetyltransferase
MVGWLEAQTERRRFSEARTAVLAADGRAGRLLVSRGFAPIRHFYRMAIDLDAPAPEAECSDGLEVSTFRLGEEALLHAVAWRGKGLGRALLLTAFGELCRRGETRVRLAVDAGNETSATQPYESVGMRVAWQADVYEKHV